MLKSGKFLKELSSGSINAGVNNVILLLTYPIFLNLLGVELYGLWTAINSLLVLAQIISVTVSPALTTFIAREWSKKKIKNVVEYLSTSFFSLILISTLLIFISFFAGESLALLFKLNEQNHDIAVTLIPVTVFLVSLIILQSVFEGVLAGLGKIELSNYLSLAGNSSRFFISLAMIIAGFNIWSMPIGWMISVFIMMFIYVHLIKKELKRKRILFLKIDLFKLKEIVNFGKYLSFSFISNLGFIPFVKVIIARYSGLADVIYFDIAWKVLASVKSLVDNASKAIVPHISKLQSDTKNGHLYNSVQIRRKVNNTLKYSAIIGIPFYVFLFLFAEIALNLWLGTKYNDMISLALRILTFGFIMDILTTPIYFTFIGFKKPEYCMYTDLAKTLLTIALINIFIYYSNINYAIIVGCVSVALSASKVVLIVGYHKYFIKLAHHTDDKNNHI